LINRVTLLVILILSFLYSLSINSIKVPLTYDVVGPKSFPMLVAGILIVSSAVLLLMQNRDKPEEGISKALRILTILFFYILTFNFFGFMLSTVLSVYMLARSLNTSWINSLLAGLILAIAVYGLLHFQLGMPLPMGYIFSLGSV